MVLLEKLWDDVVAGPRPDHGLGKLRKLNTQPILNKDGKSHSMKATSPSTTTASPRDNNVWRNVFHPGSNLNTKTIGNQLFDKPQPNSPTVYDWLYSTETKSEHR